MTDRTYPMTPQTIAAAKAHQAEEREKVYRMTGIRFVDDGPPQWRQIQCHRCGCDLRQCVCFASGENGWRG